MSDISEIKIKGRKGRKPKYATEEERKKAKQASTKKWLEKNGGSSRYNKQRNEYYKRRRAEYKELKELKAKLECLSSSEIQAISISV